MKNISVSVIIPAYNESHTIGPLVEKIRFLYPDFEVLVVDDGSMDSTARTAALTGAKVCRHPYNIGNGASIKTGIRNATGEILVFMDGDGQHDPQDIGKMLRNFPDYDMVVGERTAKDQATVFRFFGNQMFNRLASYVAKFYVRDLTSGFRAIKSDIAKKYLYLLPNTYSYPTTLTLCVLRSGRSLKYVPVHVRKRRSGKSNIGIFKDGVRFFMIIIKICTLYSPFRIFLPVSLVTFMAGMVYYLYTYLSMGRFTNMSALMFTTSVVIFMMGLVSDQIAQLRYERSEEANRPDRERK